MPCNAIPGAALLCAVPAGQLKHGRQTIVAYGNNMESFGAMPCQMPAQYTIVVVKICILSVMSLACCAMNSTILKLAGNTSFTVSAYNPFE